MEEHRLGLSCSCLSAAPAIEPSRVENVLVPCAYSPTYVVKDFPIARYQGLQFVSVSPQCLREERGHVPVGRLPKVLPSFRGLAWQGCVHLVKLQEPSPAGGSG